MMRTPLQCGLCGRECVSGMVNSVSIRVETGRLTC